MRAFSGNLKLQKKGNLAGRKEGNPDDVKLGGNKTRAVTRMRHSCAGLILERAREPGALYFAPGLACFASSEPGWLFVIYRMDSVC